MNFRFAHYDPPTTKSKKTATKNKPFNKIKFQSFPSANGSQIVAHATLNAPASDTAERKSKQPFPRSRRQSPAQRRRPVRSPSSVAPNSLDSSLESSAPREALSTLLGQGRLDPFHVYPVEVVSPYVHEVLDHAINNKWPKISPSAISLGTKKSDRRIKRGWLQCALSPTSPAFFALFYAASQHLNFLQNGVDSHELAPTLRLSYKTKAISLINKELAKLDGKKLPDDLLISILSLGAHGNKTIEKTGSTPTSASPLATAQMLNFYGNIDQEKAHMSALRRLLAHNKGIDGIDLPGLVGALQLGDLLHSTMTGQVPALAPAYPTLPDCIQALMQPAACPIPASSLPSSRPSLEVQNAMLQARALNSALKVYTSHPEQRGDITFDALTHARNLIHHNLISLPPANGLWGLTFALYDCIRIAARIYSDMIFFPIPAVSGVRVGLARQLRQAFDTVSLHNGWREGKEADVRLLLWCTVLGGIAAEEIDGVGGAVLRGYVRQRMKDCVGRLELQGWGEAEQVFERLIWWKEVCGPRGQAVWREAYGEVATPE